MNLFTRVAKAALLTIPIVLVASLPAAAATYTVDGTHSSALFKVKHFGVSNFYGTFNSISGTINYDAAKPASWSIEVTIDAESVNSRNGKRDGHIKSPDFLNAAQFPKISFKSTSVKATGETTFEVVGKLTLHGVTKTITVTAEKIGEGKHPGSGAEMIGFETRFTVDRTEFDMAFMAGPVSADVTFLLSLEAGKQAAE